jgi:hypothetical protein
MDHGPRRSGSIRRGATAFVLACVAAAAIVVAVVLEHRTAPKSALGPLPAAAPAPGAPLFEPSVATRMSLVASPLGVSPDGFARWLVRVRFAGADGAATRLVSGGDIAFTPTHGSAQWQTRLRYDGPAAIVSTTVDGPLGITARANPPLSLAATRATTNTRYWSGARASAAALGPHLVQIGWFPAALATVHVTCTDERGARRLVLVPPPSSTFRDGSVEPGARERYDVSIAGRAPSHFSVRVPAEPAHAPLSALAGKAMWLSFSPSPTDENNYRKLAAAAIVTRASASGIRAIELRTAYGPFSEITPAARPSVDALIDAAAARGITVVAWTVPRGSDYDDLARSVAAAYYRTPRGNGFAALAVDLERGSDFLGDGPAGYEAIAAYALRLREALGPEYPLIATVEDPYLGHLSGSDYPYAAVAAKVDVLQPMAYWRMMSARANSPEAVGRIVRESYAATLLVAHRTIAIDIGGQTAGEGPRGAPPPGEVAAAVRAARDAGALGVTFFDWGGTSDAQWAALARTPWGEPSSP